MRFRKDGDKSSLRIPVTVLELSQFWEELNMPEKPLKVYAIEDNGGDRKYWHEVGCAWKCKDGSLNLKLYMMPLLNMNIREQSEGKPE